MTRRDRHENIIKNFSTDCFGRHGCELRDFVSSRGLSVLTDEAIEEFAAKLVNDWRHTQKIHRRNRILHDQREALA